MKKILVCGAGGFIGTHLVIQLRELGHYVIGADLKYPEFCDTRANEFNLVDLRDKNAVSNLITSDIDEIYQLAADMGGAGYIFTGDNDANIMHNSVLINLNILDEVAKKNIKRIFYSSSACVYPEFNQMSTINPMLAEDTVYPAKPDSEYGWEKLFSERLYLTYAKNYGFSVRIARLHNVFGPLGSYNNGKEKAPAALCRKVILSEDTVKIWGTGEQTRSFLYIDDCIHGMLKIMESDYDQPLNLGSNRMISINDLAILISDIIGKKITIINNPGPTGVMGRTSDNTLINDVLNWQPPDNLEYGLEKTASWINSQLINS